ncbi:MAG: SCO family protein [Myxococcota bacterium]
MWYQRGSLLIVLLTAGCSTAATSADRRVDTLPFYQDATFAPQWLEPGAVPADFHQIPAFRLTNHRGESVDESLLDGKISVVDFFFTTCRGICPKLRKSMVRVDAAMEADADVVLLSHSVMPSKDTVEVLSDYAQTNGITSKRWHLLTGDRDQIYALGRSSYFVEDDQGEVVDKVDFLHTESMILLDGRRRIRGVYNGVNAASVDQLILDAKALLTEANPASN